MCCGCCKRCTSGYIRLLLKVPYLPLILALVITAACAVTVFVIEGIPDLSEPLLGFQSTHTQIQARRKAAEILLYDQPLPREPDLSELDTSNFTPCPPPVPGRRRRSQDVVELRGLDGEEELTGYRTKRQIQCAINDFSSRPSLIYAAADDSNLFEADHLRDMCSAAQYPDLQSTGCPHGHTVGDYVGQILGKNCSDLTDADLVTAKAIMSRCLEDHYYNETNGSLKNDSHCCGRECYFTFVIKHYMADKWFAPRSDPSNYHLTHARAFVNWPASGAWTDWYKEHILNKELTYKSVKLIGADLSSDLKFELIDEYLVLDMVYFAVAILVIVVISALYLRSALISVMTLLLVICAFCLSYFLYAIVFNMPHFPFINFIGVIVLIGIAADDVFVLTDMFEISQRLEPLQTEAHHVAYMFDHGLLSILVTSLTTAAAFAANIASNVIDVKCFGVFAAILIMCNLALAAFVTPGIIVLVHRFDKRFGCNDTSCSRFLNRIGAKTQKFFGSLFPKFISKTWLLWIILGILAAAASSVAIFYKPQLTLPTSESIQIFRSSDPIERYDQELRYTFQAQKESFPLTLTYVWGLEAKDSSNQFDPNDLGKIHVDRSFSLSTPGAQVALKDMCRDIKAQEFVKDGSGPCLMEQIEGLLMLPCQCRLVPGMNLYMNTTPCCNLGPMPYDQQLFELCFPLAYSDLLHTGYTSSEQGLVYFEGVTARALSLSLTSSFTHTLSNPEMQSYYDDITSSFRSLSAPPELSSGYVTAEFDFLDLQNSLADNMYKSILLSVAIAFGMMFLTTLNALVTLYAMIAILCSILCTIACMVVMGWQLNILEAIAITLAVGLSIDFTIHLGVAYVHASDRSTRFARVQDSLAKVGSAVTMATVTTFLAGACACGATIYSYWQFGVFLMLVMLLSFLFAMLFFTSVSYVIGPINGTCQIDALCTKRKQGSDAGESPRSTDKLSGSYQNGGTEMYAVSSNNGELKNIETGEQCPNKHNPQHADDSEEQANEPIFTSL